MKNRSIKKIISSQKINMGGHIMDQPLPTESVDYIDPFLLIHHWDSYTKPGQDPLKAGIGPHPHRGFAPVTFIYKGDLHHRDSLGNSKVINEGGTQWMHAGKGVIHSERPSKELAKNGGETEYIQFWINTPAKYKMEDPYYLPISKEDTPKVNHDGLQLGIVAGEYNGIQGPAKTYSKMTILRGTAVHDGETYIEIPTSFNVLIYILNGTITSDDKTAQNKDLIWYDNNAGYINLDVSAGTRFIVLSGEPINEPIATYGPYVMNTQREIMQALQDANSGKMGVLKET